VAEATGDAHASAWFCSDTGTRCHCDVGGRWGAGCLNVCDHSVRQDVKVAIAITVCLNRLPGLLLCALRLWQLPPLCEDWYGPRTWSHPHCAVLFAGGPQQHCSTSMHLTGRRAAEQARRCANGRSRVLRLGQKGRQTGGLRTGFSHRRCAAPLKHRPAPHAFVPNES
jgi:hypothetical protein